MAKGKTFAAGELLTAGDINTYLNPNVPSEGDPFDTGWVDAPLTTSFVAYGAGTQPRCRRIGMTVEIVGAVKPATTTVANALNASGNQNIFTLPVGFRPSGYSRVYICQGSLESRWAMTINTNGIVAGARYGNMYGGSPATQTEPPDTDTWLPFAATFMVG